MAQNEATPTIILSRRRLLTRQQIRADDKRPVALLLTVHDPGNLLGLPSELRDAGRCRSSERRRARISTKSNHKSSHPSLTQCSCRSGEHLLVSNEVPLQHTQFAQKQSSRRRLWPLQIAILAQHLGQACRSTCSSTGSHLVFSLRRTRYAAQRPHRTFHRRVDRQRLRSRRNLKAYVTAAPFPDDRPTMNSESLGIVCKVLYEVGSIVSNTQGYFLENGCVDRAERMEQKRADVAKLLNKDR